jgi:hypothetical protein
MAEERIINGYRVRRNDDGTFSTLGPANQAAQPPIDPSFQYKGPKAGADLSSTVVNTQGNVIDNEIKTATKGSSITKSKNDAIASGRTAATAGAPEGQMWNAAGTALIPIPGYLPKETPEKAGQRTADRDRMSRLNQLVAQINRTQELFDAGPGATGSWTASSLRDYLPTDANAAFDTAGASLSQQGLAAFRVPGTGTVSDRDAIMFDRANLPTASTKDASVREQLRSIRGRVDQELLALGVAPAQWKGSIPDDEKDERRQNLSASNQGGGPGAGGPGSNGPGSVWQQTYTTPGGPSGAAPMGSTSQGQPIDPAMQAELDAYIQQNGRNVTPQGLSQFITGLYGKYGHSVGPGLDQYSSDTSNALRGGGQINTNIPPETVPLSGLQQFRNDVVNNPVGAGVVGFGDSLGMGVISAFAGNDVRALGNASTANSLGMMAGQMGGAIVGTKGLGMMGRASIGRVAPSLLRGGGSAQFARDLGTDAVYSGVYGTAQGQDPLASMALGVGGSLAGRGLGRFGASVAGRDPLNAGQRAVMNAIPDQEAVNAGLREAQGLGLPMTLADVSPEVASLTGAAIRRNPTVAGQARDTLTRRNLGQIDRFRTAVSDNLGPLDNVPQRADDIVARARQQARPLYDQAYATPVPSTPELDSLLQTPFGRQAIGRSRTIAANERRSPTELGFALDDAGNPVLNPNPNDAVAKHLMARDALDQAQAAYRAGTGSADDIIAARQGVRDAEAALNAAPTPGARASVPTYTTQSLDYAKRGMDDILEEQRNQITGKLNLDEMGRSQNDVRQGLLREIDNHNPAYGQARSAYAGPAGEREALYQGRQALTEQPDLLAIQAGRQTPERLDMMRLGARDRLVQGASELSNSTNPYRTINTPAMEQRLATLYGDDATQGLMAHRDAELRMAGTSNNLIGNSMTAERQAADRAFADEGFLRPIIEGGIETAVTGAPVMTALRRLGGQKIGDAARLGFGKKGAAKAAQIGDLTLNTAPADVLQSLAQARAIDEQFKAGLSSARRRYGGMFGRGFIPMALRLGAAQ